MSVDLNSWQSPGPKCPIWSVVALSAVACGLALSGSLLRPVWHDELYTLWLARMPLADLFSALKVDSGPPLHYLICHTLYSIVGWPEGSALGTFMVRLPSVVAFSALPWVLWWWARSRGTVFFWAAALTLTWLPLLYFATEARAYALLALVNSILWLLGPDLIQKGRYHLVLFSALAAALPMLHYAGLVSFCFLPALVFFIPRLRWRSIAAALGVAALPVLAWSPHMWGAPSDSMRWVDTTAGPGHPGYASIEVLSPAGPFPALFESDFSPVPTVLSVAVLMVMMAAVLLGVVMIFRGRNQDVERQNTIVRLAIGLLPAVTLGCLAVVGLPIYFAGRTESMVWLLLVSLAATSASEVSRGIRWATLTPYAVVSLLTTGLWISRLPTQPVAIGIQIGHELASVLEPDDRTVVVGLWQLEVQHGLSEDAVRESGGSQAIAVVETLPHSQSGHPGWLDLEAATSPGLLEEARECEYEVRRRGGRIWLVWSPALAVERNVFPAFGGWRRDRVVDSPILSVDLLSPPAPGG